MILYGAPLSPFVRKVLAFAAEKGVELELVPVGMGDPNPDFAACSPFRKMPGFRDGDFTISDSTAIVTYLEAKHPSPALLPAEPESRARVIWFEEFADTIMAAIVPTLGHSRVKPSVYLRPMAQATSNSPASRKIIHAMSGCSC